MPRKGAAPQREVLPDPVYNDLTVARFINKLMLCGKKSKSEKVFYDAMEIIQKKSGKEAMKIFNTALDNVRPMIEVRPRRVGGATYQVPVEVRPKRKDALALRWIISYARARSGKSMQEKLAQEILDAASGVGSSVKKREDTHKMAEANKAFAHYRW